MSSLILREQNGKIAILTLNRAKKLNALSYEMIDQLIIHLDEVEENKNISVAIITGAGDKAFSAGGDIHQFSKTIKDEPALAVKIFSQRGQALTAKIESFPKPIIIAVNGIAFGGGCEITEAAHLAIASDKAVFSKPEIKIGIPPTFGGTQRLARLSGRKRALHLLLTGDRFTPDQALKFGLINMIVPHENLMKEAINLANKISKYSPEAIKQIISAVTRGINLSVDQGLLVEQHAFEQTILAGECHHYLERWLNRKSKMTMRHFA